MARPISIVNLTRPTDTPLVLTDLQLTRLAEAAESAAEWLGASEPGSDPWERGHALDQALTPFLPLLTSEAAPCTPQ